MYKRYTSYNYSHYIIIFYINNLFYLSFIPHYYTVSSRPALHSFLPAASFASQGNLIFVMPVVSQRSFRLRFFYYWFLNMLNKKEKKKQKKNKKKQKMIKNPIPFNRHNLKTSVESYEKGQKDWRVVGLSAIITSAEDRSSSTQGTPCWWKKYLSNIGQLG